MDIELLKAIQFIMNFMTRIKENIDATSKISSISFNPFIW